MAAVGPLIDADVHVRTPRVEELFPYLSAHWVEHFTQTLDHGPGVEYYPKGQPLTAPEAGSSLQRLRADLFDAAGVAVAVASCLYAVDGVHNPDAAAALAAAANDWLTHEWLQPEPRLRGSVVVPIQIPALAAAEIERVAQRPGFVQVLIPARTEHPLGSRLFHPLWESIERHELVAGVHFGGAPVMPPTPTGWPSYFIEEYAAMAQVFATQLSSLIVEGVFDAFPKLRVAFLESGFTWLPAHLWRMDKEWKNLRRLVPWVRRPPSEYVRRHLRLGIQPLDAPPAASRMREVVEQLGGEGMLLYTSDYPHAHAADPGAGLLAHLPSAGQAMIRSDNARALYRL